MCADAMACNVHHWDEFLDPDAKSYYQYQKCLRIVRHPYVYFGTPLVSRVISYKFTLFHDVCITKLRPFLK